MATITNLPLEVHTQIIIPFLPEKDTRAFACVSKGTYGIVDATKGTHQKDFTLWGGRTTAIPKTMSGLLCHQLKQDFLCKQPKRIFKLLRPIRDAVKEADGNPDDILTLYQKAHEINRKAMPVIVLFDFNTMEISARGLAIGLVEAVTELPDFVRVIFAHPNAAGISAYGLGTALKCAVLYNFEKVARMILAHPNAPKIPFAGNDGLKSAFIAAHEMKNPKMIETLTDFIKAIRVVPQITVTAV